MYEMVRLTEHYDARMRHSFAVSIEPFAVGCYFKRRGIERDRSCVDPAFDRIHCGHCTPSKGRQFFRDALTLERDIVRQARAVARIVFAANQWREVFARFGRDSIS